MALTAAAVSAPLLRWWEERMFTHMLMQIPALLIAGGLLVTTRPGDRRPLCNAAGIPGLFGASLVLSFWMTPIALDHAVASARWDITKAVSLVLAGAAGAASWRMAPSVVRAFFVGNLVWMGATAGLLLQDTDRRLCNAYLQDDQWRTGEALVGLAILGGLLWLAHGRCILVASALRRSHRG